jgi:excinuclease ABC subunit A
VKAQSAESIAAQLLRDHRGQHVGLLAPLVVNRKGVYTDLAEVGQGARPHAPARRRRVPADPFPRIDRFKEHTLELPVASLDVTPENEAELRALLSKTLDLGKGVLHLLHPLDGLAEAMDGGAHRPGHRRGARSSAPSAPARSAAPATPSWTRACSATTASTAGAAPASAPGWR